MQQELTLHITLGAAYAVAKGFTAPEVEQAYARAQILCRHEEKSPNLFPALFGLWRFHLSRWEIQKRSRSVLSESD
jgi:hypothetical protein